MNLTYSPSQRTPKNSKKNKITINESVELTQKHRFGSPTGSGSSLHPQGDRTKNVKLFNFEITSEKPLWDLASKAKCFAELHFRPETDGPDEEVAKLNVLFLTK